MLTPYRFFVALKAVMWLLTGVPLTGLTLGTLWAAHRIAEPAGLLHGTAAVGLGWTAVLVLIILLHRNKRQFFVLSVRTTTVLYGVWAYVMEGGLRTYQIGLSLGGHTDSYWIPSVLLIVSPDTHDDIPRAEWDIEIELGEPE